MSCAKPSLCVIKLCHEEWRYDFTHSEQTCGEFHAFPTFLSNTGGFQVPEQETRKASKAGVKMMVRGILSFTGTESHASMSNYIFTNTLYLPQFSFKVKTGVAIPSLTIRLL